MSSQEEQQPHKSPIIQKLEKKLYDEADLLMNKLNDCSSQHDMVIDSREAYDRHQDLKNWYRTTYSWVIITWELIAAIAQVILLNSSNTSEKGKVIEVMAGQGWIPYFVNIELRKRGNMTIRVKASDLYAGSECMYFHEKAEKPPKGKVYRMDAVKHIRKIKPETLILCWPPVRGKDSYNVVCEFVKHGGRTLIYLGEPSGGATGCEKFHQFISQYEVEEEVTFDDGRVFNHVGYKQWNSSNDGLFIYHFDKPINP